MTRARSITGQFTEQISLAVCRCGKSYRRRRRAQKSCSVACAAVRRRDLVPWNAGLHPPGRPATPEFREKMRQIALARPGPRVTDELDRLRDSARYREWRRAVFERDDYRCVQCGARSRVGVPVVLNADHVLPFATHPETRFDVSNGRTLCEPCHQKTPTFGGGTRVRKAELMETAA